MIRSGCPRAACRDGEKRSLLRFVLHNPLKIGGVRKLTLSDIHENVISPGVTVPWHFHETEEVIIVFEGHGECRSDQGTEAYSAGRLASASITLASTAKSSPLTKPASMQVRTTASNTCRRVSLARKRP
jgi:hypothetical protein